MSQTLYRFYDRNDVLLYVGISGAAQARWEQHRQDKTWWQEVSYVAVEHYNHRRDVLDAERAAITTEHPVHNIVHNEVPGQPQAISWWCDWCGGHIDSGGQIAVDLKAVREVLDEEHERSRLWWQIECDDCSTAEDVYALSICEVRTRHDLRQLDSRIRSKRWIEASDWRQLTAHRIASAA